MDEGPITRRQWLRGGGTLLAFAAAAAGTKVLGAAGEPAREKGEVPEVGPVEDLMREHGVLNRVLLVYDELVARIRSGRDFPPDAATAAAGVIRRFVEDYHELNEETHLFPRFEAAGKLAGLVAVLRRQHAAGRALTDAALASVREGLETRANRDKLADSLSAFVRMYRPHEAREDTVLFPAFRELVSADAYKTLGGEFERKETALFGEDGFQKAVAEVADIEKTLGIADLAAFTPTLPAK